MNQLIKFTHSDDDAIELTGNTGLSYITALGALAHTSKLCHAVRTYATDEQGLLDAINYSEGAISHIQSSITALSAIIALCENQNDIQEHLTGAMWLITGLSELASEISGIADDMQFTLSQGTKHHHQTR